MTEDYLPLSIRVDSPLGSPIEDVTWTNVTACLVVVRRMRIPAEISNILLDINIHERLITTF